MDSTRGFLSLRVLFYATATLHWRCAGGRQNLGDYPTSFADYGLVIATPRTLRHETRALLKWKDLIRRYSGKELTIFEDKLPALARIAEPFAQILVPRYYAGLWEHNIIPQLQWWVRNPTPSATRERYRTSTWSWTSSHGGIVYERFSTPIGEIVAIDCKPMWEHSIYSVVTGGHVVIKGPARDGWMDFDEIEKKYMYVVWDHVSKETGATRNQSNTRDDDYTRTLVTLKVYMDKSNQHSAWFTFLPRHIEPHAHLVEPIAQGLYLKK